MSGLKHNISHANKLFAGNARHPGYNKGKDVSERGVQITKMHYRNLGAPAIGDANGVAESQTINGEGVINGALSSNGVVINDVPRNFAAAWTGTTVLTVTGTDVNGDVIVESSPSASSYVGKKAFATITSISTSSSVTGAIVGTGNIIGLPFAILDKNEVTVKFDGAIDAATIVAADTTSPATATTGDVRGTFDTDGTLDGAKTVAAIFHNLDTASKETLHGVANYAG